MNRLLGTLSAIVVFSGACSPYDDGPFSRAQARASSGLSFEFTLAAPHRTSAGVFDPRGTLVATLWKNTALAAGQYTRTWNGTHDDGTAASSQTYTVKVLSHDVSYVWEGVIGNTSSSFVGQNLYIGGTADIDLAFSPDGQTGYVASGYQESNVTAYRFATSDPQTPSWIIPPGDLYLANYFAAADADRVYFANANNGWNNFSFVYAFHTSNNTPAPFSEGQKANDGARTWDGVIDWTAADSNGASAAPPTGLAVRADGNILAVSHGDYDDNKGQPAARGLDLVRLFDKVTGRSVGTISVANPQRLRFAPGGDLWVVCGGSGLDATQVVRFAGATLGATNAPEMTIAGLRRPLAVAIHPTNADVVLVADGGSSQQVKTFDARGNLKTTFGKLGGYADGDPRVTDDRLYLDDVAGPGGVSSGTWRYAHPLAVLADGSFWVGDAGNERTIHVSASGSYLEQIQHHETAYAMCVDPNDPSRVFSKWLEYAVDYTKPLEPGDPSGPQGNGSWKLVRNWSHGVKALSIPGDTLHSVTTLSNGRTYGTADYGGSVGVFELTSAGLRLSTQGLSTYRINEDGSIRNVSLGNGVQTWSSQALASFTPAGDPTWTPPRPIASVPYLPTDPYHLDYIRAEFPVTTSGVLISYKNTAGDGPDAMGWHLGGVRAGDDRWLWKTMPAIANDDKATKPDGQGSYGIHAFGGRAGGGAWASGSHVLYYYNGQYNAMSNQWIHAYDDGLFIGQFGEPQFGHDGDWTAVAGLAGNGIASQAVLVGKHIYAYNTDEGDHGGIHRWRIDGLDSVHEMTATGSLGGSVVLSPPDAVPDAALDAAPEPAPDTMSKEADGDARNQGGRPQDGAPGALTDGALGGPVQGDGSSGGVRGDAGARGNGAPVTDPEASAEGCSCGMAPSSSQSGVLVLSAALAAVCRSHRRRGVCRSRRRRGE